MSEIPKEVRERAEEHANYTVNGLLPTVVKSVAHDNSRLGYLAGFQDEAVKELVESVERVFNRHHKGIDWHEQSTVARMVRALEKFKGEK